MLFGSTDENYYWLASLYVNTGSNYASFGIRYVYSGGVRGNYFVNSNEGCSNYSRGVRAVVRLSPEFKP